MAEQGLDALVLAQPESFRYTTGAFPGVATFWRRVGAAFVIVPREGPMNRSQVTLKFTNVRLPH
jgi:hypothetical protein